MELVNDFNQGAIELVTCGVDNVIKTKATRFVNMCEMVVISPETGKPVKVRVTLVTEPVIFDKTAYPIASEGGFTTSVIEQLQVFEKGDKHYLGCGHKMEDA